MPSRRLRATTVARSARSTVTRFVRGCRRLRLAHHDVGDREVRCRTHISVRLRGCVERTGPLACRPVHDALPDFRLEVYLGKWEFAARHHLTASDAQTLSVAEVLGDDGLEELARLPLGYTPTWGSDALRAAIAGDVRDARARGRARLRGRRGGDVLGAARARRAGRPRRRHGAELPVDGEPPGRDRRGRVRARAAPRGRVGARPRRADRRCCARRRGSSRSTSRTTRRARCRTRRRGSSSSRCARSAGSGCSPTRSTAAWSRPAPTRCRRPPTAPRRRCRWA